MSREKIKQKETIVGGTVQKENDVFMQTDKINLHKINHLTAKSQGCLRFAEKELDEIGKGMDLHTKRRLEFVVDVLKAVNMDIEIVCKEALKSLENDTKKP